MTVDNDQRTAEGLVNLVGQLVSSQIKTLTPRGQIIFWNLMHASVSKMSPEAAKESAAAATKPAAAIVGNKSRGGAHWQQAVMQCNRMVAKCEALCERDDDDATEFASSVGEKAQSIGETIQRKQNVSDKQQGALDNMENAIDRWLGEDAFDFDRDEYPSTIIDEARPVHTQRPAPTQNSDPWGGTDIPDEYAPRTPQPQASNPFFDEDCPF